MPSDQPSDLPSDGRHRAGLLEIATIGRAHGVRGELVVFPITNRAERFAVGSALVTELGERVVRTARRAGNHWLIRFDGIDDRDKASALVGTTAYASPLDDPSELWVHELCGATVVDQHGRVAGVVTAVIANPAADLLELDTGHLVPLTFVVSHDRHDCNTGSPGAHRPGAGSPGAGRPGAHGRGTGRCESEACGDDRGGTVHVEVPDGLFEL